MSPQFRAANPENTTFSNRDVGFSSNSCSNASSVVDLARAANMEYALHKIESESSTVPQYPTVCQVTGANTTSPQSSRKRSSSCVSSLPENEPFLSSYGSAFLSGIFADIAEASSGDAIPDGDEADPSAAAAVVGGCEPCQKKARTTASTSFGRQPKSYKALTVLAEGAGSEASSPSVVSPRPNKSTLQIQFFNDQVRELQDMAFPSLPQIPITVSTSSCSASLYALTPRSVETQDEEQDSPSYGWFVSTDDDGVDTSMDQSEPSASMFLPDTKPDLAFQVITAPIMENHDIEVQQALAADTIDDVLGDLF